MTWRERIRALGPGLVLAAAGIGAGDVVVASVTGIRFGPALLWAVALTAALKYVLTEALARWQLATGETVVRAWTTRLPRWVAVLFGAYLLFWTFMVGASLSSACGLAGVSLTGRGTVPLWGAAHAAAAAGLVLANRYTGFQRIMKALIAAMAAGVLGCAAVAAENWGAIGRGLLVPTVPPGGGAQVLALLGGIGGSVTVICYGYWMRAAGWRGAERLPTVRADVRLAYVFTGLFGIALTATAAGVHAAAADGTRIAVEVAERLAAAGGPGAKAVFLAGFWCTVFTAMLGVWQGVPQIYADLAAGWRERTSRDRRERVSEATAGAAVHSAAAERGMAGAGQAGENAGAGEDRISRRIRWAALAYLAGPPLVLLWFKQPVAVVVTFSIAGAFFMPFLAATLLYLNNRREWVGGLANGWRGNAALAVCLVAFAIVCGFEVDRALR